MSAGQEVWSERIVMDPAICNGRPAIRGTRITVQTVLEFLAAGEDPEEILHQYPSLRKEDILACLSAAARLMDHQYVIKQTA